MQAHRAETWVSFRFTQATILCNYFFFATQQCRGDDNTFVGLIDIHFR
ncbi:hypothetical protein ACQUW5_01345 [Legionella sp. CNM-1927-20]